MYQQKGFTLIEMLIVIAIIAILAAIVLVGLGPVQRQGRDARRISDLREAQNALELYYNRCGFYPGSSGCSSNALPSGNGGSDGYNNMALAITQTSSLGIPQMPVDPTNSGNFVYLYGAGPSAPANSYTLGATLEDPNNSALNNSVKGVSNGIDCSGAVYCITL